MSNSTPSDSPSFIKSPKTLALDPRIRKAARLTQTAVPSMIGHVHLIWYWSLDFAKDGDFTDFEAWMIEDVAMWTGEAGLLYVALFDADLLYEDEDNGDISLVDWPKP